jgi:sulfoxide reductase heme-binding subunit YedZ
MGLLTKRRLLWIAHLGSLVPVLWLFGDWVFGNLSVNPIQDATLRTGKSALVLLVLSLASTPLNTLLGWRWTIPLRKWFGLYAFFYASVHLYIFIGLDYGFDIALLQEALLEKRFALAGLAAYLLLIPLAITSTKGWMRRLGKSWKRLHRLVYLVGILAVVHFVWLVKSDFREPLAFGGLVLLLLLLRIPPVRSLVSGLRFKRRKSIAQPSTPSPQPDLSIK